MTYFKKILILFFSVQSTGSTISTTYNIELIIFEHKEVRTNEVFETNLNIEEDEILKSFTKQFLLLIQLQTQLESMNY